MGLLVQQALHTILLWRGVLYPHVVDRDLRHGAFLLLDIVVEVVEVDHQTTDVILRVDELMVLPYLGLGTAHKTTLRHLAAGAILALEVDAVAAARTLVERIEGVEAREFVVTRLDVVEVEAQLNRVGRRLGNERSN